METKTILTIAAIAGGVVLLNSLTTNVGAATTNLIEAKTPGVVERIGETAGFRVGESIVNIPKRTIYGAYKGAWGALEHVPFQLPWYVAQGKRIINYLGG